VRKSWGTDFETYIAAQHRCHAAAAGSVESLRLHRFVYASSSSVYGDAAPIPMREDAYLQPLSPYGVTKLAAEHLCHLYFANYQVPTVSLRFFTVYGPRQRPDMAFNRFIRAGLAGQPITLYGDGEQTRDFTFVKDIVAANLAAGDRGTPEPSITSAGAAGSPSIRSSTSLVGWSAGR
jgi:UDP-glucose 4-epimerase